jgi:hypothetical protein
MSYIGRQPQYGLFEKQYFTGNGTLKSFPLTFAVSLSSSLLVVIDGAVKTPDVDYAAQGNTINFVVAPPNASKVSIIYLGKELLVPAVNGKQVTVENFTGTGAQTDFTLATVPATDTSVLVFVDGIQQRLTSNYVISGVVVQFTTAPDASAEIDVVQLGVEKQDISTVLDASITRAKLAGDIRKATIVYQEITGNTAASEGVCYVTNTNAAPITITLPAVATFGDTIEFIDGQGTFGTNNLTIARNGHKIMGLTEDLTVSVNNAANGLVYYNVANGWRMKSV